MYSFSIAILKILLTHVGFVWQIAIFLTESCWLIFGYLVNRLTIYGVRIITNTGLRIRICADFKKDLIVTVQYIHEDMCGIL